ncbi:NUDIX hydrolase [Fictibacillus phosphorivorans]|uniref:DNA mismatch repair protein MutT n=1 Tax=Fictibacillus phosphorivorans TaxID=1221500 RepID=A0A160IQI3_9BACL|nr:NUDIX domain-containing protein [Fictibacillus phosphorivorans]ANC78728.1 DNA mismatch repair protein MutT [Fictibacillus phosphorivorans]MQR94683.1 NUDIX domain-containing protein [Fictibacillus phosphorivorans]
MDYIKYVRAMVGHSKIITVVAGAFVLNEENELLLNKRSDNGQWGLPGGFMELGETVQDTARREVFEETGLKLGKLELFGIYSGHRFDKTFLNGDQVSMVKHVFTCHDFSGDLLTSNSESMDNKFFPLDQLPENLFTDHLEIIQDFLNDPERPVVK